MTPARKPGKEQKSYFRTLSTMGSVISCGAEGFKKDINYIYIKIFHRFTIQQEKERVEKPISKQQLQFAIGLRKKMTKI